LDIANARGTVESFSIPLWCGDELHELVVEPDGRTRAPAHPDARGPRDSVCGRGAVILEQCLRSGQEMAVAVATVVFCMRQERASHPSGGWDDGGRWHPDEHEWQACCGSVRPPSRAWPRSLMTHCRTAKHVAALYGVELATLRTAVKHARTADGRSENARPSRVEHDSGAFRES
jgi:hypothetical protein